MKKQELSDMMGDAESMKIEATCYDCGKDMDFFARRTGPSSIEVFGGAVLKPPQEWNTDKLLFKCDSCFKKDIHFHRPTEVYSRVVGYLRPVQNWNQAKRQEFDMRKEYKV